MKKTILFFAMVLAITLTKAQNWSLNGNTPFGTNFLGSTNPAPLNLKTEQPNQPIRFYTNAGAGSFNNLRLFIDGTTGDILTYHNLFVDENNTNIGGIANSLRFGNASGEGIGSKRNAGGNQFGLDFYTNFINRMII